MENLAGIFWKSNRPNEKLNGTLELGRESFGEYPWYDTEWKPNRDPLEIDRKTEQDCSEEPLKKTRTKRATSWNLLELQLLN